MLIEQLYKFPNKIVSLLEGSKSLALYKSPFTLVDNNTFVGIEVEVERVQRTSNVYKLPTGGFLWNNTEDGSLRNNGREFVSIPVKGKEIPFALDRLYSQLDKDPSCSGYEFTKRTGLHIHMNVRDLTQQQVISLVCLYLMLEDFYYSFAGADRKGNIFCVPMKDSESADALSYLLDTSHPYQEPYSGDDRLQILLNNWHKYIGFNLLPVSRYGTVEFRHLNGTKSIQEIITWINLILCLKVYVQRNSKEEIDNLIDSLNTSSEYLGFIQGVFGDHLKYITLPNPEYNIEQAIVRLKAMSGKYQESMQVYFDDAKVKEFSGKKGIPDDLKFYQYFRESGFIIKRGGTEKKKSLSGLEAEAIWIDDPFEAALREAPTRNTATTGRGVPAAGPAPGGGAFNRGALEEQFLREVRNFRRHNEIRIRAGLAPTPLPAHLTTLNRYIRHAQVNPARPRNAPPPNDANARVDIDDNF